MKKLLIVMILVLGTIALAEDLNPPEWRGGSSSTFQLWEFSTPETLLQPDALDNPYGVPVMDVVPIGDWFPEVEGRLGVKALSGEIDIYIPNCPLISGWKDILIQFTWKPAGETDFLWDDEPLVGVKPSIGQYELSMVSTSEDLGNGWMYSLYEIKVIPNPPSEWIAIKGDIFVDKLIVDTQCIPEPFSFALLGLGAVALLRKRKI